MSVIEICQDLSGLFLFIFIYLFIFVLYFMNINGYVPFLIKTLGTTVRA